MEGMIYGLTGEYAWERRKVWFWQAPGMLGWQRDPRSSRIRPVMIKRHRRPNGVDPFTQWAKPTAPSQSS